MTRAEQEAFVRELSAFVSKSLILAIERGDIPEAWNGIELREILARLYDGERYLNRAHMRGRLRAFNRAYAQLPRI